MLFDNKVNVGAKYYTVVIYAEGAEVAEHLHQNSNLEEAFYKSNNWFATKQAAATVAKKINEHFKKIKEAK